MRISDWSSDVCSADLAADLLAAGRGLAGVETRQLAAFGELEIAREAHAVVQAGGLRLARGRIEGGAAEGSFVVRRAEIHRVLGEVHPQQAPVACPIGRAQRRERVCQSGYSSGG